MNRISKLTKTTQLHPPIMPIMYVLPSIKPQGFLVLERNEYLARRSHASKLKIDSFWKGHRTRNPICPCKARLVRRDKANRAVTTFTNVACALRNSAELNAKLIARTRAWRHKFKQEGPIMKYVSTYLASSTFSEDRIGGRLGRSLGIRSIDAGSQRKRCQTG